MNLTKNVWLSFSLPFISPLNTDVFSTFLESLTCESPLFPYTETLTLCAMAVVSLSSPVESHIVSSPCLCLFDSLPSATVSIRNRSRLGSSFVDCWTGCRVGLKRTVHRRSRRQLRKDRSFGIVNELGGQYEDSFGDVQGQILNYFTYKATKTVMHQLYEMNPTHYRWLYDFVVNNSPADGKRFLRTLGKERHDLAERIMVTRLHLYGKWAKKCDHAAIYKQISDENLELMRERLIETVIWPTDDTNTEKIG